MVINVNPFRKFYNSFNINFMKGALFSLTLNDRLVQNGLDQGKFGAFADNLQLYRLLTGCGLEGVVSKDGFKQVSQMFK